MEAPSSSALLLGQLHTRRGGLAPHRPGWPASRLLLRVFKSSCPDGNLLPPKPIRTPGTGKVRKCRAQSELPTARPGTRSVCGRSLCGHSRLPPSPFIIWAPVPFLPQRGRSLDSAPLASETTACTWTFLGPLGSRAGFTATAERGQEA